MHRTALLSAALLLSTGAAAQDERNAQKPDPFFLTAYSEYDSNGDGIVELAEVEALVDPSLVAGLRTCDTDGDKRLSLSEYDACNGTTSEPTPADQPR